MYIYVFCEFCELLQTKKLNEQKQVNVVDGRRLRLRKGKVKRVHAVYEKQIFNK